MDGRIPFTAKWRAAKAREKRRRERRRRAEEAQDAVSLDIAFRCGPESNAEIRWLSEAGMNRGKRGLDAELSDDEIWSTK